MIASTQSRLTVALQELQKLYPDWRFGQLIANVSAWAKGPDAEAVWDVTDEELLRAAEEHLQRHAAPPTAVSK